MNIRKNSVGFGTVGILACVLVVAVIGAIGVYVWHGNSNDGAKQSASQQKDTNNPKRQTSGTARQKTSTVNPYTGWKSYTDQKYGFSFQYPGDWTIEATDPDYTPPEDSNALDAIQYSVAINLNTTEKYKAAAVFEVHANDFKKVVSIEKDLESQSPTNKIDQQDLQLKGKNATQFIITNGDAKTKEYIFDMGVRTYSFRSINEEINVQRSTTYWNDFDKVFDSLVIN